MNPLHSTARLAALSIAMACAVASAQTNAPRPSADGKTLSLGGSGSGTGKMMSRDELRSCLKLQQAVQTEGAAINTEREQIEADRAALAREQSEFTSQREAALRERDAKAERLQQAIDSHSRRVAEWKQRAVDFSESNRIGPAADRERRALDREQAEINAAGTDLEAKRAAFTRENASLVASLNKRAEAVNARIGEIEGRRNKYNERAEALSDQRQRFARECADRRYLEEDEKAIQRGQ